MTDTFDYEPDPVMAAYIQAAVILHLQEENRLRPPKHECPHCNPTAKAIRRVQDQWVVAGIE